MPRGGLLERDAELTTIGAALADARTGVGRLVVVDGVAGNGKSALLDEVVAAARADGVTVLTARGSELERQLAFGVVQQLYEREVRSGSPAERAALLADAAGPADWVLSGAAGQVAERSGGQYGFAVLHALYWLTSNLAERRPLALVVDDLHLVDRSSVRALAYVAHRLGDLSVAMLLAQRPAEPGAALDLIAPLVAEPRAVPLVLAALSATGVGALVRTGLPDADDATCAAVAAASAGNPLYAKQLVGTLARGGAVDPAEVRRLALPGLAADVQRRLAAFGPAAVGLVQAMAIVGEQGRLADAAAVAGVDEAYAADIASRLQHVDVLAAVDPYRFVHPLVHRSVYESLGVVERDAHHRAMADRLLARGADPEEVAAHLGATRPAGSVETATALQAAAHAAIEHGAPEAAATWLERAVREDAPQPPKARLLHQLGEVALAGRDPAGLDHLQAALALADEPDLRARIALDLAAMLNTAGLWVPMLEATEQARRANSSDPRLNAEILMWSAMPVMYDADSSDEDRTTARRTLMRIGEGDDWPALVSAAVLAMVDAAAGNAPAARRWSDQGLRGYRLFDERGAGDWASIQILAALLAVDDARLPATIEVLDARARVDGALFARLTATAYLAWHRIRAGDLLQGEALMRPVLTFCQENGLINAVTTLAHMITDCLVERTTMDDVATLVVSTPLEHAFARTLGGAFLEAVTGSVQFLRGDRAGAVAQLRSAVATYEDLGFGPVLGAVRSTLALALPRQDHEEAVALAERDVALAEMAGLPRPLGITLRARGLLRPGDAGLADLAGSVAVLETTTARLELARSLVAYGAALRRRGRRLEARPLLVRGHALAQDCAATRLQRTAAEELTAAGARPRRIAAIGVQALTPSELRTAQLAAAGRTNAQIAQELFVSLKTVETHLTRVYMKLDLSGGNARARLASVVGPERRAWAG